MKTYDEALKTWFLARAKVEGTFGEEPWSAVVVEHLRGCGFSKDTPLPGMGTVSRFAGTFVSHEQLAAVVMDRWECTCGKYRAYGYVELPPLHKGGGKVRAHLGELAVVGELELGDVIREVIEAGQEDG